MKSFSPYIYIFVVLVTSILIVYISFQLYKDLNIRYFSNTTEGKIIAYHTKKADARFEKDRTQVYAPEFSFIDSKNEEIKVITKVFSDTLKYEKGDTVTVYYNPNNPKKAYIIDSFLWKRRTIILLVGLVSFIFAFAPLFKHYKQ